MLGWLWFFFNLLTPARIFYIFLASKPIVLAWLCNFSILLTPASIIYIFLASKRIMLAFYVAFQKNETNKCRDAVYVCV